MVGEQGQMPEPINRDQRRRVERGAQGMIVQQRPGASGRKGKKRYAARGCPATAGSAVAVDDPAAVQVVG